MRVACSTWDGGGNVAVFRALAHRLRAMGHEVDITVDVWDAVPTFGDADVHLVDCMTSMPGIEAALATGRPVAAVVHVLASFVPLLEGSWAPAGYLDLLASLDRQLVFSPRELDVPDDAPANLRHVGPVLEEPGPDAGWRPPDRSLVVVSLGTTDMEEGPVLQRVLDALAPLDIDVLATTGEHLDRGAIEVPANATLAGLVRHTAVLPHADAFVGHGGHGGIMAALAHGVPVVSIPLGRDQPLNAARVEAVGAGLTLPVDAEPDAIRDAVTSARLGESIRVAASAMADVIAGYGTAALDEVTALSSR